MNGCGWTSRIIHGTQPSDLGLTSRASAGLGAGALEGLMRTKGWQGAEMAGLAGRFRTPRATDAREGTRWFAERCGGANGRAIRRNGSEADGTG